MTAPKAFISYSWSTEAHQKWVLELATELRESGIDVTIDKWDLREGHDPYAFMESMVTDPKITKVIVILDKVYAEKADKRSGGAGTEAQIMSPEIYKSVDQNKFVGVISEVDPSGKPYLPAFYKSRIYIDLSNDEQRVANFEQLVRWAFDKPAFPKPPLGKRPTYLEELEVLLPTRAKANRAVSLLKAGEPTAAGALQDYFDAITDNLGELRHDPDAPGEPDDRFIQSLEKFLPYRDEYISVISALAKGEVDDRKCTLLVRFFEKLMPFVFRPANTTVWADAWSRNFEFIIHELFLHLAALLLRHEQFSALNEILGANYYVGDIQDLRHESTIPFYVFRQPARMFDVRNKRLGLNRAIPWADTINERASPGGVSMEELTQADLVLYLRDAVDAVAGNRRNRWWPVSTIYTQNNFRQMELFARSISAKYFSRFCPVLGVTKIEEFRAVMGQIGAGTGLFVPHAGYWTLEVQTLVQPDKLCTRP